jgi:glycosyltransferase involved in cell wall biosynthesis
LTPSTLMIVLSSNTSWYLYNFRASTIRQLRRAGFSITCISPEDDYSQKLMDDLDCQWYPLHMSNQGSNPFKDAGLILQFFRYYRELQPVAVLHFTIKNNVYGTWAARVLGIPAINNVSGLGTAFIRKGIVSAIVRLLYKTSQLFAHRVFCQNEEDFSQLVHSKLVAPQRLELLPGSGVDLERFHPALQKTHAGPFRFLFAGRMLADKGLFELIAAVRAINAKGIQCELWLSGFADVDNVSAISHEQLAHWAEQPGVNWLGPTDTIEDVYAAVDCVVLPSYREGMPRSLLESGAMGLPVIATDVPGCRNIVEDGYNGLLCPARDSVSLRGAMQKMLFMPAGERETMGRNGRTRVEHQYDELYVVEATMRAVESAISGH